MAFNLPGGHLGLRIASEKVSERTRSHTDPEDILKRKKLESYIYIYIKGCSVYILLAWPCVGSLESQQSLVVAHTFNTCTGEADLCLEASLVYSGVPGQSGLHRETLEQTKRLRQEDKFGAAWATLPVVDQVGLLSKTSKQIKHVWGSSSVEGLHV